MIFDLDGTTLADHGEVPAAFTTALAEQGITVTAEQIRAVRGGSKRQALFELTPPGPDRERRVESMYASFRANLAQGFAAGIEEVQGAQLTFRWLHEQGIKVAINTGFERALVDRLLPSLGWDVSLFAAVVCGDEVSQGRPSPYMIFHAMEIARVTDVKHVAVVGDTPNDLLAGSQAGLHWNIGVISSAYDRASLEAFPHTHILASVTDLPSLWG